MREFGGQDGPIGLACSRCLVRSASSLPAATRCVSPSATGWFLAKAVLETGGLGWAWFVHFVQDVIILIAILGAL